MIKKKLKKPLVKTNSKSILLENSKLKKDIAIIEENKKLKKQYEMLKAKGKIKKDKVVMEKKEKYVKITTTDKDLSLVLSLLDGYVDIESKNRGEGDEWNIIVDAYEFDYKGMRDAFGKSASFEYFEKDVVKEGKKSTIILPNTNIELVGFGRDVNGNSLIKLKNPTGKGYSIQTNNGSMPKTHRLKTGGVTIYELTGAELNDIADEVIDYISEVGTAKQKEGLISEMMDETIYEEIGVDSIVDDGEEVVEEADELKIDVYALNDNVEKAVLSDIIENLDNNIYINAYVGKNMQDFYASDKDGKVIELPSFRKGDITEKDLVGGNFEEAEAYIYINLDDEEIEEGCGSKETKDLVTEEVSTYPITFESGISEEEGMKQLLGRRKDFETYMKAQEDGIDIYDYDELQTFTDDKDLQSFGNYGLSFEYKELGSFEDQEEDYFVYLLSYGGGQDEIRFYQDGKTEYVVLDWGTGIGFDVTSDEVYSWLRNDFEEIGSLNFEKERQDSGYYEKMNEKEYEAEYAEYKKEFDSFIEGKTFIDEDGDEIDIEDYESELIDELRDGYSMEEAISNYEFTIQ